MKIKHAITIEPGTTLTLGGIAGATLNGTDVSVNDNILDINAATAVKLNDTTYNVDSSGLIDLGNISTGGSEPNDANLHISLNNTSLADFTANSSTDTSVNINAATSVTVNTSTTYNVSTNGNIDLGEVAKTVTFQGQIYHPNSSGQVQLPTIYTIKNGSILGGSLSQNNATSDISSKVNPIGYLNCSHNTSPSGTIPVGYLLNWNGEYIYCILALKSLNITSDYNYTCQLYCEVFGGKSGVTIYPHVPKSITKLTSDTIKFQLAIKGLTNDTKPKNYAFSTTTTTTSSYSLSIDYYEGESSNVAPTNLTSQTGITESGVYTIDYEVVNNEVTSYVITRHGGQGQANDGVLTLNLNNSSIGQFTANQSLNTSINVNACTSITVNSSTYNVSSNGNINLGTISGGGGSGVNKVVVNEIEYTANNNKVDIGHYVFFKDYFLVTKPYSFIEFDWQYNVGDFIFMSVESDYYYQKFRLSRKTMGSSYVGIAHLIEYSNINNDYALECVYVSGQQYISSVRQKSGVLLKQYMNNTLNQENLMVTIYMPTSYANITTTVYDASNSLPSGNEYVMLNAIANGWSNINKNATNFVCYKNGTVYYNQFAS